MSPLQYSRRLFAATALRWAGVLAGGPASWSALASARRAEAAPANPAPHSGPSPSARSGPAAGFGQARSVVVLFASGGQSQIDTWDPKPLAPSGIRSEFAPIATALPGVHLCEHLPRMSQALRFGTLVRSVSHDDLDHGSASYLSLTGHFHLRKSSNPPPAPTDYPTLGAVLQRVRPSPRFPHTAIHLNGPALVPELPACGQNGGFLGRGYDPFLLGDVTEGGSPVPTLDPLPELPGNRLLVRQSLLAALEAASPAPSNATRSLDLGVQYEQAFRLLATPQARAAFDLTREPAAVRARYGDHRSGQACLLARRLVEAEVPWVTVILNPSNRGQDKAPNSTDAYGWDTHNDIFPSLREHLLPRFDLTFSALLEDLDARGLLATTLVICLGEFGRAPRIALEPGFAGQSPGRKHWAGVYSVFLAGAGIPRGAVFGASDPLGGRPLEGRVSPCDLAATLFWSLGIDPQSHYEDLTGRPIILSSGRPLRELYGSPSRRS